MSRVRQACRTRGDRWETASVLQPACNPQRERNVVLTSLAGARPRMCVLDGHLTPASQGASTPTHAAPGSLQDDVLQPWPRLEVDRDLGLTLRALPQGGHAIPVPGATEQRPGHGRTPVIRLARHAAGG